MPRGRKNSGKGPAPASAAPAALRTIPSEGLGGGWGLPLVLLLALVGLAATTLLMTDDVFTSRLGTLTDTPQWVIWVVVLAVESAVSLAVAPAVLREALRNPGRFAWPSLAHFATVLVLVALPLLLNDRFEPSHEIQTILGERVSVFNALGIAVAVVAAAGVVGVNAEISSQNGGSTDGAAETYLELRKRLRLLGGILAVLVALAVLAAGAQRNAVVAMETAAAVAAKAEAEAIVSTEGDSPETKAANAEKKAALLARSARATQAATDFGVEVVWGYGLYYSFVLVLVYLPPYLSLVGLGRAIRDTNARWKPPSDDDYDTVKKKRDAWDEALELKVTATDTLRAAAVVLVPLATSLASNLLGGVEVAG